MKTKVTAVFDIGKTNKKFFLFDSNFQEVHRTYTRFEEIKDEDGYPTEDLEKLTHWMKSVFDKMLKSDVFEIKALNFSCYGASLVHLDKDGKVLTPLYNYLKPIKEDIIKDFYDTYGPETEISRLTGSPKLEMINSGIQLYWLKKTKPKVFKEIKHSLHFPQYLSYLFTGKPVSEYTSIGCHTLLWDFEKKDYHSWVYKEQIDLKLPPIVSTRLPQTITYKGKKVKVGTGVHDSSSALLPYVRSISKPFILVSTGTWSISINPFSTAMLKGSDIKKQSLFNMRIDGSPAKVSRLFLGNEYKLQAIELTERFKVAEDAHKQVKFDPAIFEEINKNRVHMFSWKSMASSEMPAETKVKHNTFEYAYHQLLLELVLLQVKSIKAAKGKTKIKRVYIDGGFSDNEVYIQMLCQFLNKMKIRTTDASLGSALGAAIVISDITLDSKFLKKNYALKKQIAQLFHKV